MKTQQYDFIIGYEHKNREIESICLLKIELEHRGYSVFIYNTNDQRLKEHIRAYHAEVLLLPYAYETEHISFCVQQSITFNKLINLQWEQALNKYEEDNVDSYQTPSGICKKAVHLSWGMSNVRRLNRVSGIDSNNIRLVGNITLDFLKEPLCKYYISKEKIYKQYGIPLDKKICLFIASFLIMQSEEEIEGMVKQFGGWVKEQHEIGLKTCHTILQWIQKALEMDTELFFIYRPHPGDRIDFVYGLQKKCDRFVVIKDLSVKQWILIVDKIYTWTSTTVAEIYSAQKSCYILYPYEVSENSKMRLFENAVVIKTFQSFYQSLKSEHTDFPIDIDVLDDYYSIDAKMNYCRIADVCEEVLNCSQYQIDRDSLRRVYKIPVRGKSLFKRINIYLWQIDWIYKLFFRIANTVPHKFKCSYFEQKLAEKVSYEKWRKEEWVSQKEIHNICSRLKSILKM